MPNSSAKVTKVMSAEPRKISEIIVELSFEDNELTDLQKRKLTEVAENCPVAKSLNPDIKQTIKFKF